MGITALEHKPRPDRLIFTDRRIDCGVSKRKNLPGRLFGEVAQGIPAILNDRITLEILIYTFESGRELLAHTHSHSGLSMQIRIVDVDIVGAGGGLDVEQRACQGTAPGDRHGSGQLRPVGQCRTKFVLHCPFFISFLEVINLIRIDCGLRRVLRRAAIAITVTTG